MKTGLALSGGAVRGMAHIGVLKYLEEKGLEVDLIAGTSAGSLVGALYAAGKTAAEIEEIALDIHWKDIIKYVYSVSFPKKGLINIEFLQKIIHKYLGSVTFAELKKPLIIVAVDLIKNQAVHIKTGEVTSAVMASCAIPGIFTPVQREGLTLVDGGVLQNIPTAPLVAAGVKNIIAVDLNARSFPTEAPHNIFDILYRSLYLMAKEKDREYRGQATFLIEPELDHVGLWDLEKTRELIDLGYKEAQKTLENVKLKESFISKLFSVPN
jgi:NTE family protein